MNVENPRLFCPRPLTVFSDPNPKKRRISLNDFLYFPKIICFMTTHLKTVLNQKCSQVSIVEKELLKG